MRFVRFTEVNEHEGEIWRLWIQLDGNETELGKLAGLLKEEEERAELDYTLDLDDPREAFYVDVLVEEATRVCHGYHPSDTRVLGTFRCPTLQDLEDKDLELDEALYKFGLLDFVS